jgi:hypothetical protein
MSFAASPASRAREVPGPITGQLCRRSSTDAVRAGRGATPVNSTRVFTSALGAFIGRDLGGGFGVVFFTGSFAAICLRSEHHSARRDSLYTVDELMAGYRSDAPMESLDARFAAYVKAC